jgi:hydrogenase expression/formation protein HypC
VVKEVSLAMVPEAETGQYVLVHAGLAIGVIDEDEARKLLEDLLQLADAEEEFAP